MKYTFSQTLENGSRKDAGNEQVVPVKEQIVVQLNGNGGGRFPRQCVRERFALTTKPLNLVKLSEGLQTQDRIQIVHQTLRHISKIYSMNLGSVTKDRNKVENLRLLLDRQLNELEECVRKQGSEARLRKNSTIQKYFRKLRKFLKQKTFSNCAWEIIRAETRARLQQLLYLMAQIRRRN
ncbi:interferon alpha-F-like [Scyliorhinus canicula]|uniref:interferon alpha-F-like n=1 Tax=Scyliorhinus canicula TaxID=7830 RepID=UPI0018F28C06|nr:interferon alpha-F-like [Scyliorhinus canicula]